MGVRTAADDLVDQARKDVDAALKSTHSAFTGIMIDKVWGSDEWSQEFKAKLVKAQSALMDVKLLLGERVYFD